MDIFEFILRKDLNEDSDLGFMPGPYSTQAQSQSGESKPTLTAGEKEELEMQLQSLLKQKQDASNSGDATTATNLGAQIERLRKQIDQSVTEGFKTITTAGHIKNKIRVALFEYAVPLGFSLDKWLKYRKDRKTTNIEYHKQHPKKKWKVVYAHSRKDKYHRGESMKGYDRVSYNRALKRIRAEKAGG
jgi:hypothetical protein